VVTVLTKSLAAIAAGVFGQKRAGDRRPADSKRAQLGQPSPPFSESIRSADFSMTLWIWRFILSSMALVVLTLLLFSAIDGFGGLGLSGKGLVALTLRFLFTAGHSSSSATTAVATTRPIGRPSAKRERAIFP
jgi:hypothetical protein